MEDLFGNGTETVKLWGLTLKPGVLETVLNSVNTPQVMLELDVLESVLNSVKTPWVMLKLDVLETVLNSVNTP